MIEKKFFEQALGSDCDTNLRSLPQQAYLRLMNGRIAVSKNGRGKRIENCAGTTLLQNTKLPPYGLSQTIGSTTYTHTDGSQRIVFANYNTSGDDGIYVYDVTNSAFYAVIYDSQVIGGLNFSKDFRINRNMKVLGGILYLCDGENNEPRSINIEAGIKANQSSYVTNEVPYSFPIDWTQLTIIKSPPPFAPNFTKNTDSSTNINLIATGSFEFAFQFVYYTNETSVIGTYSSSTRLNKNGDTYNFIRVTMDAFQQIPSTVKVVRLIVRIGNGKEGSVIAKAVKTWDKNIQLERNEIINQNAGLSQLTFDFYNNIQGETIAEDLVLKPYDTVPIYAKTIEQAKNRNFLGNIVEGYDTPTTTSLTLTPLSQVISSSSYTTNVIRFDLSYILPSGSIAAYLVYLPNVAIPGYYYVIKNAFGSTLPPPPVSFPFSSLAFAGTTQSEVIANNSINVIFSNFSTLSDNIQITGIVLQAYDVFKTSATYKVGIVFYDFAMRKCGVVTNDGLGFNIPKRDYSFSTGIYAVTWTLSNTNALTEIPEWAYYYAPVRTLNQLTRFFVESYTDACKYAIKQTNGDYDFSSVLFNANTVGIALDTSPLVQSGLGYTYTEGDVAVITFNNGDVKTLPVFAQDGKYIIVKSSDLGNLSNRQAIYQIFSPYKQSLQEPFYEVGEVYKINNPTTSSRSYSTLSDFFAPDSYILRRVYNGFQYYAEAMSPNDLYYQRWDNDSGKPNFITTLGQVKKWDYGRFSNVFISGTANNGLNTFEALNQFSISNSAGEIQNLILTDKVQDKGTVMVCICTNETASIYLGETQISDGTGQTQFFAQAQGVVGTINPLKGSFGTVNPESVITYLGLIFWFDALNGVFVQYSPNGLEPVSRYGMMRFFQNYASEYRAASTNNLDNINGFHHCPTFFDTFHKEIGITLPALIYDNYADILPSYSSVPSYATSIINRFDVFDRLGKSISFCYEENKWGQDYNFMGEWYEHIENRMFGWKNGVMYEFNADAANTNRFFGVQYPTRLCFVANFNPSLLKVLDAIAVEGNEAPNFTVALAAYPNLQITDLQGSTDYIDEEGFFRASFYKDRLSPNSIGTPEQRLYTGDSLTDVAIQIMLEWQKYNGLLWVNAVDVNYSASRGSKSLTQPNNL